MQCARFSAHDLVCMLYCERFSVPSSHGDTHILSWHPHNLSNLDVQKTRFEGKEWLNRSVNDEAVCRTAPATLVLLIMTKTGKYKILHIKVFCLKVFDIIAFRRSDWDEELEKKWWLSKRYIFWRNPFLTCNPVHCGVRRDTARGPGSGPKRASWRRPVFVNCLEDDLCL